MENERSGSSGSSSGSGSESESDGGSSSGSTNGSSSGNSSEAEEECLESVSVLGRSLSLPQGLCESRAIFDQVLSSRTWELLTEEDRQRLRGFLPTFKENDAREKERTVQALFAREPFHFSSPLDIFHTNLKQGNYRPDIAKMKKFLIKARQRQQKHKMKAYYAALVPEVLLARERLLAAATSSPPGPLPRIPPLPHTRPRRQCKPAHARAKLRYFEELTAIHSEVGEDHISADENYPDGPPQQTRRQRRHLTAMQNAASGGIASTLGGVESSRPSSLECLKHVLAAHRARRQRKENHPELQTSGITLDEIKQRVALVNGTKKISFASSKPELPKQKRPKKEPTAPKPKEVKPPIIKTPKREYELLDDIKQLTDMLVKSETAGSDSENSFIDPGESPKAKRLKFSPVKVEIKQEAERYPHKPSTSAAKELNVQIKKEPLDPIPAYKQPAITTPVPIKLEDLEGIDMMDLPVELADCDVTDSPVPSPAPSPHDPALMDTTHANFLSMVRALFPASSAHRATRQELQSRAKAMLSSPIAALNTWYSLSNDWCAELESALKFLAGEKGPHPDDFVPYLTYNSETQIYQWIGAGRDGDALLGRLCERWLCARTTPVAEPPPPPSPHRSIQPQPPRHSTTWTVRPPTSSELADFHQQEKRRYSSAGKPFTYVQHGYRSVVGPAGRGPANRASHAAILVSDRPRYVSFVSLVKDAVARLPNGEGTRSQIMTLLKMSQYLSVSNETTLASAVSDALDRLHTVKRDPFLRYDQKTKFWIYLHRHKSEEDWERSMRSRPGTSKPKNPEAKSAPAKEVSAPAPPPPPPPPPPPSQSPIKMEVDIVRIEPETMASGSDTDVDVDDSGPNTTPTPHNTPQSRLLASTSRSTPPKPLTPHQKLLHQIRMPQHNRPKTVQKDALSLSKSPTQTQPKSSPQPPKSKIHLHQKILRSKQPPSSPQQSAQESQSTSQQKLQDPQRIPIRKEPTTFQEALQQSLQPTMQPLQSKTQPTAQQTLQPAIQQTLQQSLQSTTQNTSQQTTSQQTTLQPPAFQSTARLLQQTVPQSKPMLQSTQQTFQQAFQQSSLQQIVLAQATTTQQVLQQVSHTTQASSPQIVLPKPPTITPPRSSPLIQVTSSAKSAVKHKFLIQVGETVSQAASSVQVVTSQHLVPVSAVTTAQQSAPVSSVSFTTAAIVATCASTMPQQVATQPVQTKINQATRSLLLKMPTPSSVVSAATTTAPALVTNAQVTVGGRRGVVRVLSPATPASGKSLISPRALMHQGTAQAKRRTPVTQTSVPTNSVVQPTAVSVPTASTLVCTSTVATTAPRAQTRTVQLAGGRTVQLATSHLTLPTPQTVQLSSGHTLQLSSLGVGARVPTAQAPRASVVVRPAAQQPASKGSIQQSASSVQLAAVSTQLARGVKLGQTVQLAGGQTIQLANGQTVQLGSGVAGSRSSATTQGADKPQQTQPLRAKLLTNAQGQVISVEGVMGAGRTLQLANVTQQTPKQITAVQGVSGVRVVGVGAGARMTRPLLLTHKPLHNIILQQGEGGRLQATSAATSTPNQTLVLSSIAAPTSGSAATSAPPVLKLQQLGAMQQLKLAQGIKLQQANSTGAVRGVVVEGQQLKLVSNAGRHVLARVLRPPPHQQ